MKTRNLVATIGLCVALMGTAMTCAPSAQKVVYNTLASVQVATSGAYSAYLDLVVTGKLSTNSVPLVSKDYTVYQQVWQVAVTTAALGVQAPATQPVTDAAAKVVADITIAKATP